mmetsp:Transcript_24292/g.77540  ORF Transcript_24292/g.77540 Transcript_24292/m.77540 type:complete len:349 (+) Transcript_24292:63-1109(+)
MLWNVWVACGQSCSSRSGFGRWPAGAGPTFGGATPCGSAKLSTVGPTPKVPSTEEEDAEEVAAGAPAGAGGGSASASRAGPPPLTKGSNTISLCHFSKQVVDPWIGLFFRVQCSATLQNPHRPRVCAPQMTHLGFFWRSGTQMCWLPERRSFRPSSVLPQPRSRRLPSLGRSAACSAEVRYTRPWKLASCKGSSAAARASCGGASLWLAPCPRAATTASRLPSVSSDGARARLSGRASSETGRPPCSRKAAKRRAPSSSRLTSSANSSRATPSRALSSSAAARTRRRRSSTRGGAPSPPFQLQPPSFIAAPAASRGPRSGSPSAPRQQQRPSCATNCSSEDKRPHGAW